MKRLKKHFLKYDLAWEFVKDSLEQANTLSDELLKNVRFEHGLFYTFLPNHAEFKSIYNFKLGGILKQNLENIDSNESGYSVIPTIRSELTEILVRIIKEDKDLTCIFDDINASSKEMFLNDVFHPYRWIYDEEIYLIFNSLSISEDKVLYGMQQSQAFWHSLCVLTKINFESKSNRNLSLADIQKVCLNIHLIIVGAYDGEGYVVWERDWKETS